MSSLIHNLYFPIPEANKCIALNYKSGTTSIARALIAQFYLDTAKSIENAHYPEGFDRTKFKPQGLVPHINDPEGLEVLLLCRNPLDRFISAMKETESFLSKDEIFKQMSSGEGIKNLHFFKQSRFMVTGNERAFRLEDQLEVFEQESGLKLEKFNSHKDKPSLTKSEEKLVRDYYKEDFKLWENGNI